MSGGAIFNEALSQVCRAKLVPSAERDLVAVLEAGRIALPFFNELRYDCPDLDRAVVLHRAGALYALFCAGNLADDLIDGEATYLDDPLRFGPSAQFILHNLAVAHLLDAGVPAADMAAFAHELVQAGGPAHVENRMTAWDLPTFKLVTDAVAGRQYAGFLFALW